MSDDSGVVTESRSSVQVNRTAKGDAQISVKVYVGTSDDDLNAARDQALRVYDEMTKQLYGLLGVGA